MKWGHRNLDYSFKRGGYGSTTLVKDERRRGVQRNTRYVS